MWTEWGSLEPANVAVELCLGDPAAAADVHGAQLPALHERVHRRATDAEHLRRLLGREEKPTGGHDVAERLRITHVDLSRLRHKCCWQQPSANGLQNISSTCPAPRIRRLPSADWTLERLHLATAEVLER
jgi:hypothetical protein